MRALDAEAKSKNLIFLSEIGLDPGLDHCSAIGLLSRVDQANQVPVSFTSFCGGLPAPEDCPDTPFGLQYKFSWSPLGVLRAALNGATFLLNGKEHSITGERLLRENFGELVFGGVNLRMEGIANRDSLPYRQEYGLGSVRTVVRGTLRYPGFSRTMQIFKTVGLLSTTERMSIHSWEELLLKALSSVSGTRLRAGDDDSIRAVLAEVTGPEIDISLRVLREVGLLSGTGGPGLSVGAQGSGLAVPTTHSQTALEHFAELLSTRLAYRSHERDMVVLSHEVIARPKELKRSAAAGGSEVVYTSSLLVTGTPSTGQSAMSRTVGLPLAFGTLEVLDGKVEARGVLGGAAVWRRVLEGMSEVGIEMRESHSSAVEGSMEEQLLERRV